MIVTVHIVLIGGMLLQGCKDTAKDTSKDPAISQAGDTTSLTNGVPAPEPAIPAISTSSISNVAMSPMPQTEPMASPLPAMSPSPMASTAPELAPAPALRDGKDYSIVKGDTLAAIAKRNSVSLRALSEANPGVNARKLKVGQKLQIPASTGAVASAKTSSGAMPAMAEAMTDGATYTVKSGDTLGKIARAHGTSYKKIMAMNDLKTTAIRVGQKLKMPAPKPIGAEPLPAAAVVSTTPGPVSSLSTPASGTAN
jgi:LysM repeat protein